MKPPILTQIVAVSTLVLAIAALVALPAASASASGIPTHIVGAVSTGNSIQLTWTNPRDEGSALKGLTIRRNHGANAPDTITSGTEVTTTTATQTTFTDVPLVPSATYSYSLFARFTDGTVSAPAKITTYTVPNWTTNLGWVAASQTSIKLTWTNPSGSGFKSTEIVRDDGTTPPTNPSLHYSHRVTVATTDSHTTSFIDTGLHIGTTYSYALFAGNADGRANGAGTTATTETVTWTGGVVSGNGIDSLSCPSTTFCAAVDGNFNAVEWNGTSWTSPVQWDDPDGEVGVLTWVSCSSANFCIAVDDYGNESTWIGGRWQSPQHIDADSGYGLDGISCVKNEEYCVAIDGDGHAYTFHNDTWNGPSVVDRNSSDGLFDVSCASDNFCVAYDLKADDRFTFNGSTWSMASSSLVGRPYVSCPNTGFCMGMDYDGNTELYDGHHWSVGAHIALPAHGTLQIQTVACAWSTHCIAGAADGRVYTYAGPTTSTGGGWIQNKQLNYQVSFDASSCAGSALCALGGARPQLGYDGMIFTGKSN